MWSGRLFFGFLKTTLDPDTSSSPKPFLLSSSQLHSHHQLRQNGQYTPISQSEYTGFTRHDHVCDSNSYFSAPPFPETIGPSSYINGRAHFFSQYTCIRKLSHFMFFITFLFFSQTFNLSDRPSPNGKLFEKCFTDTTTRTPNLSLMILTSAHGRAHSTGVRTIRENHIIIIIIIIIAVI